MSPTAEATFTDFLRDPRKVTERLDTGDVILRRRDAEDLRLSVASRVAATEETLSFLSRVIADALEDEVVRERIGHHAALPWLTFLPPTARERFYAELFECVEGAVELGTLAPVARLLDEWRVTAAVHADPDLARRLHGPLPGDGATVTRPAAE